VHRKFVIHVLLAWVTCCNAQSLLQIIPPKPPRFFPGQTIILTVTVDSSVSNINIVSEYPLGFAQSTNGTLQFSIFIPPDTPINDYQITAVGTVRGKLVQSAPITVSVDTLQRPVSVRPDVKTLFFANVGEIFPLRIIATFADGTKKDATYSHFISYKSTDPAVATVDVRGVVTATGPGRAYIKINGGAANILVKVSQNQTTSPLPQ